MLGHGSTASLRLCPLLSHPSWLLYALRVGIRVGLALKMTSLFTHVCHVAARDVDTCLESHNSPHCQCCELQHPLMQACSLSIGLGFRVQSFRWMTNPHDVITLPASATSAAPVNLQACINTCLLSCVKTGSHGAWHSRISNLEVIFTAGFCWD